jgi:hypothetical protein
MERSVTVNAGSGSKANPRLTGTAGWRPVGIHGQWDTQPGPDPGADYPPNWSEEDAPAPRAATTADQGPCLYFGPAGQRCDRRATKDGFCYRHQPGAPTIVAPFLTPKKIAAFLAVVAMLWPELAKLMAALVRLFH